MSGIVKYTVDPIGFIPHKWQVYRHPIYGLLKCISVDLQTCGRATITAELIRETRGCSK